MIAIWSDSLVDPERALIAAIKSLWDAVSKTASLSVRDLTDRQRLLQFGHTGVHDLGAIESECLQFDMVFNELLKHRHGIARQLFPVQKGGRSAVNLKRIAE